MTHRPIHTLTKLDNGSKFEISAELGLERETITRYFVSMAIGHRMKSIKINFEKTGNKKKKNKKVWTRSHWILVNTKQLASNCWMRPLIVLSRITPTQVGIWNVNFLLVLDFWAETSKNRAKYGSGVQKWVLKTKLHRLKNCVVVCLFWRQNFVVWSSSGYCVRHYLCRWGFFIPLQIYVYEILFKMKS